MAHRREGIPATEYTIEYFLHHCDGHLEFLNDRSSELPARLRTVWEYAAVASGARVLDVGCGRGELLVHGALQGASMVGIDYSTASVGLSSKFISHLSREFWTQLPEPVILRADATTLPFDSESFDTVIMSDIVEHLSPPQLAMALSEVRRVLRPGGKLLIHTMPNLWYYRFGYPVYRLAMLLKGATLPADPRQRYEYSHVHINEQTPCALRRTLKQSGFHDYRVWLSDYRQYEDQGRLMQFVLKNLTTCAITKHVFCDDIFAIARR